MHGRAAALSALLALPSLALPQQGDETAPTPDFPTDERIREAWSYLRADERFEVSEWFQLEVSFLETFQKQLADYLVGSLEVDPGTFPAAEPPAFYDPEVHAPRQPIPRVLLAEDAPRVARTRPKLLRNSADPLLDAAFRYDWASGRIVRAGDERDPERVFANALAGFPPGLDLAQALLEGQLDDGSERDALRAFGHAYANRVGSVYPGVSLYDAWASGEQIEMPDVEVLGIVHDLMGEWKRWVAPVPASQHDALYEAVGEHFQRARRHRGLREALARAYLRGGGVPDDVWLESLDRLHTLWEEHSSTPTSLAEALPDVEAWEPFLEDLAQRCEEEPELLAKGQHRRQVLDWNRWQVKSTLVWVLREFGAFERTELPPPPPEPVPPPPSDPPEDGGVGSGGMEENRP